MDDKLEFIEQVEEEDELIDVRLVNDVAEELERED